MSEDMLEPKEDKKWMPIAEAAQMLGKSEDELHQLAMAGRIKWVLSFGNWLLNRDDIEWMAANPKKVEEIIQSFKDK